MCVKNTGLHRVRRSLFFLSPLWHTQKHRNPCFYKEAGKDSFVILPKDSWKELHHGDRFSLLPEDLVFRVEDSKREER